MGWLPEGLHWGLAAFSLILQLIGFFGLLLIFFPGLTVIWVGQIVWAIFIRFNLAEGQPAHGWTIAIFVLNTLLMVLGNIIDNILIVNKTRREGVPWWGIALSWAAMIGVGFIATPMSGLLAGFAAIFLIQYFRLDQDWRQAFRAMKAMIASSARATVYRLGFASIMLIGWLVVIFVLPKGF